MGFSQKKEIWKILLIEDNPADTRLIQELLKESSVKTVLKTRNRISAGIKSLQDEKFDVILLDLTLPDASGIEALNKINNVTTDLPIIIITGLSDEALASTAVREGAQDYLFKRSIDSYSLSRSIQYAIERKQSERLLRLSQERLSSFMNSATDNFIFFDSNLNVIEMNIQAQGELKKVGIDPSSVIGMNILELNPLSKETGSYEKYQDVIRTGKPFDYDVVPSPKFGNRHLHTKAFKVGDGIGVITTDNTAQKNLEKDLVKAKTRLEHLLTSNPAVIYTSEPHGDFSTTFMSENIKELVGYEAHKFLRTPDFWVNLMHPEDRERIFASYCEIPEKGYYNETYRVQHKNGTYRWVLEEAKLIEDEHGNPLEIVGFWSDVTEQKQSELKLGESEEKYRLLVEKSLEGIVIIQDGRYKYVNPSFAKTVGYRADELLNFSPDDIWALIHPDDRKNLEKRNEAIQAGQQLPPKHTFRYKRKDGSTRWVEASGTEITFNERPAMQVFEKDITVRKKTEKALQQQTFDLKERVKELDCLYTVLKYSSDPERSIEEVIMKILESVPPAWQFPEITCARINLDEKVHKTDNFQQTPWGLSADVIVYGKERGRMEVFYLTEKSESFEGPFLKEERDLINALATELGDFIEFKRSEEALRESEDRYRTLFEGVPIGLYRSTPDGKFLAANPAFLEMLGFSPSEDISQTDVAIVASKIDYPREKYQELIETNGIVSGLELQVKKLDGSQIFIRENAKTIKDSSGSILYYEGSLEDITESKLLEEALIRAKNTLEEKVFERTQDLSLEKQRIENILATIPEGIIVFNAKGEVLVANNVFKEIYERIYDKNLPKTLREFHILGNPFADTISRLFYSKKGKTLTVEPLKAFHLQITSTKLLTISDLFQGLIITVRDISPFIEFEITQKQFVATVSHELRTPITIIDLSIKNLQKYRTKLSEKQTEEVIGSIINSSFSLKQMIEDLLIISKIETKKFKLNWTKYCLRDILTDILSTFESPMKIKQISVQIDVNSEIELYGDPMRIGQIFRILLDNAVKFTLKDGSLIEIKAIEHYKGEYNLKNADGVLIQVIDSGVGIREKDLTQIFERFFRSIDVKDIQGVGLGLSVAKMMVSQHQGDIFVKSRYGKGSTFSVFFPRIKQV